MIGTTRRLVRPFQFLHSCCIVPSSTALIRLKAAFSSIFFLLGLSRNKLLLNYFDKVFLARVYKKFVTNNQPNISMIHIWPCPNILTPFGHFLLFDEACETNFRTKCRQLLIVFSLGITFHDGLLFAFFSLLVLLSCVSYHSRSPFITFGSVDQYTQWLICCFVLRASSSNLVQGPKPTRMKVLLGLIASSSSLYLGLDFRKLKTSRENFSCYMLLFAYCLLRLFPKLYRFMFWCSSESGWSNFCRSN